MYRDLNQDRLSEKVAPELCGPHLWNISMVPTLGIVNRWSCIGYIFKDFERLVVKKEDLSELFRYDEIKCRIISLYHTACW